MGKLLKYEFFKLRKQKSFIICSTLLFAINAFSALLNKNATAASELVGFMSSGYLYAIIIGIFVSLFVCEDYEQQLVKNIFSKGYSRTGVYFATFIAVVAAATVMILLAMLSAFLFGFIRGGAGTFDADAGGKITNDVIVVFVFVCFFFAVAAIIRKTGGVIAVNVIAPVVVYILLTAIDARLKIDFSITSVWFVSFFSGDLFSMFSGKPLDLGLKTTLSAGYIVLFIVAGWLLNRKTQA